MEDSDVRYTPHVLPINDNLLLPFLAKKYTQLRLKGLQQSPQSFSATLQGEQNLTEQQQMERIKVPNKHIVILVLQKEEEEKIAWYECEWVAQATLFGPHSWHNHIAPFQKALPSHMQLKEEEIVRTTQVVKKHLDRTAFWHMTALYVDANHRRRGLGNQLCNFAFELTESKLASNQTTTEMRIIIKPTNLAVLAMYEKMRFIKQSQPISLSEATFAAGDQDTLPTDYTKQQIFTKRLGIVMTRLNE